MALFRKKYRQPYEAELIIIQALKIRYTTSSVRNIIQKKFSLGMSYSKDELISKVEPALYKLQEVSEVNLLWDNYYAVLCVSDGLKEERSIYYIGGRFLEAQCFAAEIGKMLSK